MFIRMGFLQPIQLYFLKLSKSLGKGRKEDGERGHLSIKPKDLHKNKEECGCG